MRLPKRPIDPALAPGAPLTPKSNKVHPDRSAAGSPASASPKPRRLPPLTIPPAAKLEVEPEAEPEPEQHAEARLTPGQAKSRKRRELHGLENEELLSAFRMFDLDESGVLALDACMPVQAAVQHTDSLTTLSLVPYDRRRRLSGDY